LDQRCSCTRIIDAFGQPALAFGRRDFNDCVEQLAQAGNVVAEFRECGGGFGWYAGLCVRRSSC